MTSTSGLRRRPTLTPQHRRWRDLSAGRLSLGLCLAPLSVPITFVLFNATEGETFEDMLIPGVAILVFVVGWALMFGWVYLLAVVKPRGRIARIECLLLGIAMNDLLPIVLALASILAEPDGAAALASPEVGGALLGGVLVLSLLGLLGGWLFWRLGVRPAPVPAPDVMAVFD